MTSKHNLFETVLRGGQTASHTFEMTKETIQKVLLWFILPILLLDMWLVSRNLPSAASPDEFIYSAAPDSPGNGHTHLGHHHAGHPARDHAPDDEAAAQKAAQKQTRSIEQQQQDYDRDR